MADTKLSALPSGSAIADADLLYSDQSGNSVKQPASAIATYLSGSKGFTTNLAWFNVKNYGATGNGSTDDTSSINSAIAALNTATKGILYFPAGTYKISSALTTITATGICKGDGSGNRGDVVQANSSLISTTSNNTVCFTTNTNYFEFQDLALQSVSSPTPASGSSAILVTGSSGDEKVNFINIVTYNFYDAIDVRTGQGWIIERCAINNFCHYGVRCQNTNIGDAGGWVIHATTFSASSGAAAPTSGARIESGGGDHITDCNFISGVTNPMANGIDVAPNHNTVDLFICNCTLENFSNVGIQAINGANTWDNITITGCEIAGYTGSPVNAIKINANNVAISNVVFPTGFTPAINIVGGSNISVSNIAYTNSARLVFGTPPATTPIAVNDSTGGVGGGQFFQYTEPNSGIEQRLSWTGRANFIPELQIICATNTFPAGYKAQNSGGQNITLQQLGSAASSDASTGQLCADSGLIFISDNTVSSGGSDPVIVRAGGSGSGQEVARFLAAGNIKYTNAANFSANGTVATALTGAVGPTGSHTTVQTWLTFVDNGGTTRYVPCF